MAGNKNSGRRKIDSNSAEIRRKLAEIAVKGLPYLDDVAHGRVKEACQKRVDVINRAIEQTIGKPHQSTDILAEISSIPISGITHHLDFGDNGHKREERDDNRGTESSDQGEGKALQGVT